MTARPALSLALAVALLHLLLIQPNHPGAMTWGALRLFPLELPVIVILLLVASGPARAALRIAITAFLTAMSVVKAADYAAFATYGRGFNLLLDGHLLPAAWNLASGAVGPLLAATGVLALLLAAVAIAWLAWWATGRLARVEPARPLRLGLGAALVPAVAAATADLRREDGRFDPPGAAFTAHLAAEHTTRVIATREDLMRFRREAERDAFAKVPADRLLGRLRGHDVLMTFVESYGRSTLENPRYAPTIRARLAEIEASLDEAGLAVRSGWLTAPMVGGQSWLAHGSVLSGLRIDNQRRYQALLASPRRTLLHHAGAAGWRVVGVMPAITMPWPEGAYFGYDAFFAAADLGYRGKPFNWVTMPDQYTLRALERLALEPADRPPVFAEVALISSHAPWTPVPQLIDWDLVGDGTVFDAMATSGDPPEVVWRDRDRVRAQFVASVDYALETVGSFAARRAGSATLMIVLGDHEPAAFVSELPESFDVPVHLIGPPELVRHAESWGWAPGMLPDSETPAWPMASFRDRFLDAFTPSNGTALPGGIPPRAEAEDTSASRALPDKRAH